MNMITVDFAQKTHAPKPVNGVNNGPICNQSIINLSRHYKALNIPSVRLHDTDGANSRFLVDVSRIFPNFDADENEAKNYFFGPTDKLLNAIHALGAEIVYRFGESIDHDKDAGWFATPPKDFAKWARICVNIIRHYNDGWANGFYLNIKFWEIWNEGEGINEHGLRCNWRNGTEEQLFDLYKIASRQFKAYDPSLQIGGMAFCGYNDALEKFIQFCKENDLPLDFFSYHGYDKYVEDLAATACRVRAKLDEFGFNDTKVFFDEWNYVGFERDVPGDIWMHIRNDDTPELCQEVHENQRSEVGGAYVAAAMISMNELPIDKAHYYDGQCISTWCGLFNSYAIPQKPYYSFKAYGDIYANCDTLVKTECDIPGFYAISAEGEAFKGIMITSLRGHGDYFDLEINNLGDGRKKIEYYITDKDKNMHLNSTEYIAGDAVSLSLKLETYALAYLKIYSV